jgi:hypothetical protein
MKEYEENYLNLPGGFSDVAGQYAGTKGLRN